MRFATRVLRVNGIAPNVLDAGKGPAVLPQHGFPDDRVRLADGAAMLFILPRFGWLRAVRGKRQ